MLKRLSAVTLGTALFLLVPAAAAQADTYIQINIAGGVKYNGSTQAATDISNTLADSGALAASINEICVGQVESLVAKRPDFQVVYQQTLSSAGSCGGRSFGNAIAIRKTLSITAAERTTYANQTGSAEKRGYMCAVINGQWRFCTTHLVSDNATTRYFQAAELRDRANQSLAAGTPIAIGGDFNVTPTDDTVGLFYSSDYNGSPRSNGRFLEVDGGCFDRTVSNSTCNEPTFDGLPDKKLDYLFVSKGHFGVTGGDATDTPTSDHQVLRGYVGRNF